MLCDLLYLVPISYFLFFIFLEETVNIYIALMIIVIIVVEIWLIDMITEHIFPGELGKIAKYFYHGLGFFLSL